MRSQTSRFATAMYYNLDTNTHDVFRHMNESCLEQWARNRCWVSEERIYRLGMQEFTQTEWNEIQWDVVYLTLKSEEQMQEYLDTYNEYDN